MSIVSTQANKPTIVFVHGAFTESSSWNGVLTRLLARGYPTVAVANPLRGVKVKGNACAGNSATRGRSQLGAAVGGR